MKNMAMTFVLFFSMQAFSAKYSCTEFSGPYGAPLKRVHVVQFNMEDPSDCTVAPDVSVSVFNSKGELKPFKNLWGSYFCCREKNGDISFGRTDSENGKPVQAYLSKANGYYAGTFTWGYKDPEGYKSESYMIKCDEN